jgi:NADP-dependent 3-hydroxy acid dehydrogenase YdfG
MLRPEDIATAVMTIVQAPAGVCPIEIVLEPQRDPMRGIN